MRDTNRVELLSLDLQHTLGRRLPGVAVPQTVLGQNEYALLDEVRVIEAHDAVLFARTGLFGLLAIVRSTGAVVQLAGRDAHDEIDSPPRAVSPSIEEFAAISDRVRDWWLGLGEDLPSERIGPLRTRLHEGGFASLDDPDGYWRTLLDDIEIGDYDDVRGED